ncbi:MAG: trifunctional transcriptional regulator/proline dehydrogenase/L-glutamate gamma-semialdehyde dehydrogenase [Sphingomonadales bacterium]|nr:trifunctional transcriptional regulator/proline dehydrogenase/L-glutamate gamma-semialdehyde dehydrogenase [Sphingomonadales bacterium]MDE2171432.1 trifunctional transcriptional regulator/proline dehydrogenase/L-glutamate gamma-semialdehyde dehydrogenase [Sphingomonadales bacterium]
MNDQSPASRPFADFAPAIRPQTPLRAAITAAYRRSEEACLASLIEAATVSKDLKAQIAGTAASLVGKLREQGKRGGVEGLVQEYALSSQEGVALMCLAEALLRIPDHATRDALIRDKVAMGDWRSHLGGAKSIFVNAATWGLVVTGRLIDSVDEKGLSGALTRLVARAGEPVVRRGMDMAMRMMGEQFVAGETIEEALDHGRPLEAKGFRYSYDMLGEAATTAQDATRFYAEYETAIHAIGKSTQGASAYERAGISIKLSALHPRYSRSQADRVMEELLPRVRDLAVLARGYDIGFNIDAEEQDRLELSLDLLESLAFDPALAGWNGLGFVVQAYGKRCPFVLDWMIDLARRSGHRFMVRLVKGAYWDAEIKRAQVDGLPDFPVYTRKHHTDVAYIACARKLLGAPDAIFPQFATHNAQTLATIHHLAGGDFDTDRYEFQCLHGMGEALYDHVVARDGLARPCRIYAPVGTHETLLAYLVRRLLENGANSSFVHRIGDTSVSIAELVADPVDQTLRDSTPGAAHELIARPDHLFTDRVNSAGLDLSDETMLSMLDEALQGSATREWHAAPEGALGQDALVQPHPVHNPGDHRDVVGMAHYATPDQAKQAVSRAAASTWANFPAHERAAMLERAADAMQAQMPPLLGLIMREAGKSLPNAIAEVREAVDFLRYYAAQARTTLTGTQQPLGPVVCISPWNFPLAIFTGQIAAALVTGNPVLAKPAEETPLIAAQAVRILHEAGVPADALQLLPGEGDIGAALVAAPETAGVVFTGSTQVARLIQRQLATRLSPAGRPLPLIAETGGQNAMIVDSSALAEQVVGDCIASAFDSAGQRCSALRILCLQDDIADRTLDMLRGAMDELRIGRTDRLAIDIGPVITAEAQQGIEAHVEYMRAKGCHITRLALPGDAAHGTFVAPTIIEIDSIADLQGEVFGPVLHVLRYAREDLDALIDAINATGYGLTFGLHTRLDQTIAHVTSRIAAGNLYVNRNVIGATVGVQPFGGRGLSGTGPKAGGPLYLGRLTASLKASQQHPASAIPAPLADFIGWLEAQGEAKLAATARSYGRSTRLDQSIELPGPVGERNIYACHPRGRVLLKAATREGLYDQIAAVLATGNSAVLSEERMPAGLPASVAARLSTDVTSPLAAALIEGEPKEILAVTQQLAALPGSIVSPHAVAVGEVGRYPLDALLEEVTISTNTTAAGGNASLMMIG